LECGIVEVQSKHERDSASAELGESDVWRCFQSEFGRSGTAQQPSKLDVRNCVQPTNGGYKPSRGPSKLDNGRFISEKLAKTAKESATFSSERPR
jgi:hypothetical protein